MRRLEKYQNRCQNRDFSFPDRLLVGIRDFQSKNRGNADEFGMVGQSATESWIT